MNIKQLNSHEATHFATQQLFSLENGIAKGVYSLEDIGDLMPGAIMVHQMNDLVNTQEITYMNEWGCEKLGHSMDEINSMGEEYYKEFFLPEQSAIFISEMIDYYKRKDYSEQYNFFHQVRIGSQLEFQWYYAMCKFLRRSEDADDSTSLIMVASPVAGIGSMINIGNKILDQNVFVAKNYKKFVSLTKREKEIIILLAEGKSSPEISDLLFISKHTVNKHRMNIVNKLEVSSFAELLKFAIAFELVHY
jgi:DNA-binding CsgD family transcriptional regulator